MPLRILGETDHGLPDEMRASRERTHAEAVACHALILPPHPAGPQLSREHHIGRAKQLVVRAYFL